jgi:hypothetical protein
VTGFQTAAIAVASLAGAQGSALFVGHLAGHRAEIAGSWADGRAWVTAHRARLRQVRLPRVRVLPAGPGRHRRAGVTA